MLCADSYRSPESMERDLRNLKMTAINNPSRSRSIFQSFVTDLNFWDVDSGSNSTNGSGNHSKHHQNIQCRSHIPSLQQAMELHEKQEREDSEPGSNSKTLWKSAVDPATGNTYYYHTITRKTQWEKPAELKALERRKKQEKRRRDRKFFDEMEKNIERSLARGEVIPGIPIHETKKEGSPKEPLPKSRVRTISGMDDFLLAELRDDYNDNKRANTQEQSVNKQQRVSELRQSSTSTAAGSDSKSRIPLPKAGRPPLPSMRQNSARVQKKDSDDDDDLQLSPDIEQNGKGHPGQQPSPQKQESDLAGEKFLDSPIHNDSTWQLGNELGAERVASLPGHARRNTGGTIYLQHTMINPDIKATIKCVCGVYRAHIVQSKQDETHLQQKIDSLSFSGKVFHDDYGVSANRSAVTIPSLSEVVSFYDAFYRRSQMEHDTIITSLIYVERVIKSTDGALTPNAENWRSLLFACMVLASKVWDDLSMWNIDFSNVSAHTAGLSSFTLRRINQLELELLKSLKFDVKVPASEYAKYYFLIRTMLLRSGLVKEDEKPLQKRDAFRKLELLTRTFLCEPPERISRDRRSKSMDESISTVLSKEKSGPVLKDSVCLEQLVG